LQQFSLLSLIICEWRQFVKICKTAPKSDIIVLVLTFVLTVVFDLVVAIEIGMLVTAILFLKRMTEVTKVRKWTDAGDSDAPDSERLKTVPAGTEVIEIEGPMFFATADVLEDINVNPETKVLILRMRNIPALDISAMKAIDAIHDYCVKKNIRLLLSHANEQPLSVMKKAGFYDKIGAEGFLANIDEALEKAEEICK